MILYDIEETMTTYPHFRFLKGCYIMKDYQKPEFELINLVAQEKITSGPSIENPGGDIGFESNNYFG